LPFFATLGIRLLPMYQEYMGVVKILGSMEDELKNNKMTKQQVELMMSRRFDIGYIKSVKAENMEILRGKNTPYITKIVIDYEVREPFMFHIDLIGHFVEEIDVESGA
jgi:hypothetical protein